MAIGTGGTTSQVILTALLAPGSFTNPGTGVVYPPSGGPPTGVETDVDIATINQAIKDDFLPTTAPVIPYAPSLGGYSRQGQLYIPNRGWLKVYPGDAIMVDGLGWPILVSARSRANATYWITTAT